MFCPLPQDAETHRAFAQTSALARRLQATLHFHIRHLFSEPVEWMSFKKKIKQKKKQRLFLFWSISLAFPQQELPHYFIHLEV